MFKRNLLLGSWINELKPDESEHIRIDFTSDSTLTYAIIYPDKVQKIFLTYRIEKNILCTNQSSNPKEEQTEFIISHDGKMLTLIYDDEPTIFLRVLDVEQRFLSKPT